MRGTFCRVPSPPVAALPPEVRTYLDELTAKLRESAGENLIGVVLYGGLARGRDDPATSDINLVLVLRDTSAAALARLADNTFARAVLDPGVPGTAKV